MPISYIYNTIHIHIPKCGGTTIEKILGTCSPKEYYCIPKIKPDQKKSLQHYTYLELKRDLEIDWSRFFVFSVVRNPYSRIVSEYKYRKKYTGPFDDFIKNLNLDVDSRIRSFDGHLETQTSYLKNEQGEIDSKIKIFKFEDINECIGVLSEKTKIPFKNSMWSRKNSDPTPYQNFYTPESKKIIQDFYAEDFVNFGYSTDL